MDPIPSSHNIFMISAWWKAQGETLSRKQSKTRRDLTCTRQEKKKKYERTNCPYAGISNLHRKVQFKLRWEFLLRVQAIREVYPSQATVCMDLYSQCLHIISTISSLGEINQVKLDLIPSLIHSQWHSANVGLYSSDSL